MRPSDTITIDSLSLHLPHGIGPSAFGLDPPPPCPVSTSLSLHLRDDVVRSCAADDTMGGLGVNYSTLSKKVTTMAHSRRWNAPRDLAQSVAELGLDEKVVNKVDVLVTLPKASLEASSVEYASTWTREGEVESECTVKGIRVMVIIGLHPHEQTTKQWIEVDVGGLRDHRTLDVYKWLESSSFGTMEALADNLAQYILTTHDTTVRVTIRKPSALPFATPIMSITRRRSDYPKEKRVFVALGSNIGDRVAHLTRAVNLLARDTRVVQCSRLYESEPMYVENQDRFINGVVEIETDLPPRDLLRLLKGIEETVGRTKSFRNGPRVVDLDLLFYGQEVLRIDEDLWLELPHPRIAEREFVLRPMADLAPDFLHPISRQTISSLLTCSTLAPIIPLSPPLRLDRRPRIMQIFNATPDSFSDGNDDHLDVAKALASIQKLFDIPHPPDILDIGGMSTRPNAVPCSESEELSRVVPLITAVRSWNPAIRISIDTFRPTVARAAVQAGASCINDVRGGTEPGMLENMVELDVPVVLMHSRGDSTSMTQAQDYSGGVEQRVKMELQERIDAALKAGIKSWNIMVDPGLGFAKSPEQSVELLRGIGEWALGYPVVVGGSRKGFVGGVIGRSGKEEAALRGYGDAAVVSWCAFQGVDVVRVHDGRGMGEVVKMLEVLRK